MSRLAAAEPLGLGAQRREAAVLREDALEEVQGSERVVPENHRLIGLILECSGGTW